MTTEILALIISLVAVIVGPIASLMVAKKYIRSQLILTARISEINDFSKNISEFLSKAWALNTIVTIHEKQPEGLTAEVIEKPTVELMSLIPRVKLYLIAGCTLHDAIIDNLNTILRMCLGHLKGEKTMILKSVLDELAPRLRDLLHKEREKINKEI